jgi:hypothetical protein
MISKIKSAISSTTKEELFYLMSLGNIENIFLWAKFLQKKINKPILKK